MPCEGVAENSLMHADLLDWCSKHLSLVPSDVRPAYKDAPV
jgi:hypothetical protein